ncbi:MAG: polymer-forming cytoskeletal protein [Acidobacteriota bacterium]
MKSKYSFGLAILLLMTGFGVGCDASVNKSIRIEEGEKVQGGLTSVNGNVTVGADAEVDGGVKTVNGRIKVRDRVAIRDLVTVNGSIDVDEAAKIDGDVTSVNGSIQVEAGVTIDGKVETVNGRIDLEGTTVTGRIETRNGSIRLAGKSRVEGSIEVEPTGGGSSSGGLQIEILEGSVVEGDIVSRSNSREVKVLLDSTSEVRGELKGVEVVRQPETATEGSEAS